MLTLIIIGLYAQDGFAQWFFGRQYRHFPRRGKQMTLEEGKEGMREGAEERVF